MTQICRKINLHVTIKWSILERVSVFRQFFQFIWDRILACSIGKPVRYRRLTRQPSSPPPEAIEAGGFAPSEELSSRFSGYNADSDLVPLKISLLGDCRIGKTSFVVKYVGDEQEKKCLEMTGLNLMDKTLFVQGARITFSIWDVGGDSRSLDHVPIACKDAVAILFMFDLTSRCTLNSVVEWYSQARKWNQARAYAKAMKATLFFSSAKHNINVNKIFKFIMAKLFNLPWTLERNLTIGEPIIDF
ncbi:sgp1 monomeric G-protein, putative [Ricinus communis]|uniref:Sgp1 monomeric G-protein, putative n=1 Tax=Ricinus communis TaxID=3988 RepID=B9SAI2_RICCO|nr:sgp1 monomeric G-protein, putative [Ricinus communis]